MRLRMMVMMKMSSNTPRPSEVLAPYKHTEIIMALSYDARFLPYSNTKHTSEFCTGIMKDLIDFHNSDLLSAYLTFSTMGTTCIFT